MTCVWYSANAVKKLLSIWIINTNDLRKSIAIQVTINLKGGITRLKRVDPKIS